MQHLTAIHLNKGWQYATTSKRGGGPIGYCGLEQHWHDSELGARECYARYERDEIHLDGKATDWGGCTICDAPTKNLAQSGAYRSARLCDDHLTRDHAVTAMQLDEPAGDWVLR